MSQLNMEEMFGAGVHFGHQVHRWNPKMKPYVYTLEGGIHIINLEKTLSLAKKALNFIEDTVAQGGSIIFVGTKKQASLLVKEEAQKCSQYYVNKRWLGGTLTNFQTIKMSIDRMKKIDQMREMGGLDRYSKKERSQIEKDQAKLNEYLEGIREMKDLPKALFVVDINKENIAIAEANKLGIPVVALVDTNCDPDLVDYVIPANDDSIRSIQLFIEQVGQACLKGKKKWQEKVRDKKSDTPASHAQPEAQASDEVVQGSGGAASGGVVQVFRNRKLVAAGTAEDVEIAMELEAQQTDEASSDSKKEKQSSAFEEDSSEDK